MKFLFDLPNEELLPATYDLADEIEKFAKATKIMDLRTAPADGESAKDAGTKNLKKMLFRICKEFPKETGALCDKLWVLEDGEKAPNAIITFGKAFTRRDVLDFFTSLLQLAQ